LKIKKEKEKEKKGGVFFSLKEKGKNGHNNYSFSKIR